MNTLGTAIMTDPHGKVSECIQFTIDDVTKPFVLNDVMTDERQYTFSLWLMTEEGASISVSGATFSSVDTWRKFFVTFTSNRANLAIEFNAPGVYYFYHPQLEIGNKPSDYTPAPEDAIDHADNTYLSKEEGGSRLSQAESLIQQLNNSISMVVSGLESISFVEQTEDGWTFSLGSVQSALDKASNDLQALNEEIGNTNDTVGILNQSINKFGTYVKIQEYENEPCIELGAGNSDFKLLITNTRILFMEGSACPTYITNQTMYTDKIRVLTEIQQGDFVWTERTNGNLGLMWKGATD